MEKEKAENMISFLHYKGLKIVPAELLRDCLDGAFRLPADYTPPFLRGDKVRYQDQPKIGVVKWSTRMVTGVMWPGETKPCETPTRHLKRVG